MNDKGVSNEKIEVRPFFMSDMMRLLSELENVVWDNHVPFDKVKMQNIIIMIKSQMIQIDKDDQNIITVAGFKYKRVFE